MKRVIFWFRQDLRLSDNPGLYEASKNSEVLPIYVFDDQAAGEFKTGSASKVWLNESLKKLDKSLNGNLNIYEGSSIDIILELVKKHNITHVYWNRCYEPWRIRDDSEIKLKLKELGIECQSFNGSLLWEPWEITKKDGQAYKVYTAYYKNGCLKTSTPRFPLQAPENIKIIKDKAAEKTLKQEKWQNKILDYWHIGEKSAWQSLENFLDNKLFGYAEGRDYFDQNYCSKLSPYLHFGEISPNQVWHSAINAAMINGCNQDLQKLLSELAWREFSYYLLYHFPKLAVDNFQAKFDHFPWQDDAILLAAWQKGLTGYPIVDAGMRELWQTGYMHNRVRMIVASFLVKNLLIHWHKGRDWFWDCLFDADLASNSASWQWVAGSGADAAPFFRIFNPVLQGEKFDKEGAYTKHFLPELKNLDKRYLFKPWEAPDHLLKEAGIVLGVNYPKPIVTLAESRDAALHAYKRL